jgi:hypothetical protein
VLGGLISRTSHSLDVVTMEKKSDPIKVSPKMDSGMKNGSSRLMKELWAQKEKKKKKERKKRELVIRGKRLKLLGCVIM